jgi:hypothetical protein
MLRRVDILLTDVSEERRITQELHCAKSQKTAFFIDWEDLLEWFVVWNSAMVL